MVSPGDAGHRVRLFECAEITGQGRAAELVIIRGRAYGSFQHDIQGRGNVVRFVHAPFPGLRQAGDVKVGDGEAREAGPGFGPAAGCGLIANFAAGTGGRAGKR